jgi:hypothetical protein
MAVAAVACGDGIVLLLALLMLLRGFLSLSGHCPGRHRLAVAEAHALNPTDRLCQQAGFCASI